MNHIIKMSMIAFSTIIVAACSVQDSQTTDPKPEHMAEHNPQMHSEAHTQEEGHSMQTEERIAVLLSADERLHVLSEMRGLLQSTQGIIEGLALDDMELVQKSALAAGTKGRKTTENNIMHKKMPKEWMQLGMMAHKTMDEIAAMAVDGKPAKEIQLKLLDTMNACTACHTVYYLPEN